MGERSRAQAPIAIVGGGVIGITTAVVLQALGFATVVYAERAPAVPQGTISPPDFATVHAAASVLPHSVRTGRAVKWTQATTALLRTLESVGHPGVRLQRHFEVFESPTTPLPDYASALDRIELIKDEPDRPLQFPRREGATAASGWSFDAWFCEGPLYIAGLQALYQEMGGTVVSAATSIEALVRDGCETVVVCAGHNSPRVAHLAGAFDDPDPADGYTAIEDPYESRFILGYYVRARVPDLLRDGGGRVVSYNYHPPPDVYADPMGQPADVYCYPRHDAWLLGGTRIPFDSLEAAIRSVRSGVGTERIHLPAADGSRLAVPRPILELNRDLIQSLAADDLDVTALDPNSGQLWAGVGLRFERTDPSDSTRVEASRVRVAGNRCVVVHNYGHGGAGFTLSWGCAIDVAHLVLREIEQREAAISGEPHAGARPEISNVTRAIVALVAGDRPSSAV